MKRNLKIHKATENDISDILKIREEGWLSGYVDLDKEAIKNYYKKQHETKQIENLKKYLSSPNHNCYLAEYERKNIGLFWFEDNDRKSNDTCYIYGFYVLPHFQGQGVGSALWNFGIGKMKEKGYSKCSLITTSKNEKSKKFYYFHDGVISKEYIEQMIDGDEQSKILVDEFTFNI